MPKEITLTVLKRYLQDCPQEQLVNDAIELFKKIPSVKDYYQLKLQPGDISEVVSKYKKIIEHEFFPARGFGKARLSVAKKAIAEYQKICESHSSLIDVMLFYVEQGVKFTSAYGDIDEPFYSSMEGVYEKAIAAIVKHDLSHEFQERCAKIVRDTSGTGWGFHDTLSDIYRTAFPE